MSQIKSLFLKSALFCLCACFVPLLCKAKGKTEEYNSTPSVERLKAHLTAITKTDGFRNYKNTKVLNQVADYIKAELEKSCDTVCFQPYTASNGVEYKNVIGSLGPKNAPRIIVGAHYDVCGDQEGADDNASGVAGVLELANLLKHDKLVYRIDFVAYCLEEPPFFRTESMGSHVHAKWLHDNAINVKGMVCLEMIGYFSDQSGSQQYPTKVLKPFYGDTGDYLLLVRRMGGGSFGTEFTRNMKNYQLMETRALKAPSKVQGIDFSDHQNYWKFNYSAVMVTNTAFYRNKNYHQTTDTMETLDFKRMSAVVNEIYLALKGIK